MKAACIAAFWWLSLCGAYHAGEMRAPLPAVRPVTAYHLVALGDEDWSRDFRTFLRHLNLFVLDYNDGKLNIREWEKASDAWKHLQR